MDYSVVFAALDEAATIEAMVRGALEAIGNDGEVLVVDDGSTDETGRLAAAAGARVIKHSRSLGKGAAQRRGATEARGRVLVFLDADGQDEPSEIPRLLAAIDSADLVIGSRFLGSIAPGALSSLNAAGNRMLTAIINRLFGCRLTDTQAGFRAIRRSTYLGCAPSASGFDVEADLLLAVLRAGLSVAEVGVSRKPREHGESRLSTVRDGTRILLRILTHRLRA